MPPWVSGVMPALLQAWRICSYICLLHWQCTLRSVVVLCSQVWHPGLAKTLKASVDCLTTINSQCGVPHVHAMGGTAIMHV